jgi:hypothetical protein
MFDIEFIEDDPEMQEEGWYGLWGRTTMGKFSERFLASLSLWSRADYERQWLEAARRLLAGEERTAFFTNAFQFWWIMWREGSEIVVRQQFLIPELLEELGPAPDLKRTPYELIGPRETDGEPDEQISEWRISVANMQAFLDSRGP